MESDSHTYTETGEYEVVLTVSDGAKSDTDKITITVNDGSPVISYTYSTSSLEAPFEVSFDASSSVDPEGGDLTYAWDFGNGTTANTPVATATYVEDGDYTVSLTVTNESGKKDSEEFVVSVGNSNCIFDTPRATSLPSMDNESFENIYVLGEDGPDLSIVNRFTVNWNLTQSGLYEFSMNLSVSPNYVNFKEAAQNFDSAQPEIAISNSGVAGLDGSYYVTVDEENFVMVSKDAGFTLYFSKTAEEPECSNDSNVNLSNPTLDLANYEINVYPNPTIGFVNVLVKTIEDFKNVEREIVVLNILGQVVASKTINYGETEVQLNITGLASGAYFVLINVDGQKLKTEELIVK